HGIKITEIAPGMVDTEIRADSIHPSVLAALAARKFEALTSAEVAEAGVYAAQAAPNCCPELIQLRPQGSACRGSSRGGEEPGHGKDDRKGTGESAQDFKQDADPQ